MDYDSSSYIQCVLMKYSNDYLLLLKLTHFGQWVWPSCILLALSHW